MNTPTAKEIVAAKAALQGLLNSNLLRSSTLVSLLAGCPSDEQLPDLPPPSLQDLAAHLMGFLSSSVQYLLGMLSQFEPGSAPENVLRNLQALLLAYLALLPEFSLAEEHILLLANCYEQSGRQGDAQALLSLLLPADAFPN